MQKIIEFLSYELIKGSAEEFHNIMLSESLPLHRKYNINVLYSNKSIEIPDNYLLIRTYSSLKEMENQQNKFYSCEDWKKSIREKIINKIVKSVRNVMDIDEFKLVYKKL